MPSAPPPAERSATAAPPIRAEIIADQAEAPPHRMPPAPARARATERRERKRSDEEPALGLRWIFYSWEGFFYAWECFFGAITLIIGLAVLATVPVLNMLSLGYLLEASGRVAYTGKIREGFVGVRKAYRVGSLVAGTYLMLLPLYFISDIWYTSSLIDPKSTVTLGWRIGLIIATVFMCAHILLAWYAGGKFRHFFWPFVFPVELLYGIAVWQWRRQAVHNEWPPPILLVQGMWKGDMYTASRDAVWNFVIGLRLPYYFWMGLRGFVGALIWLALPVTVLVVGANLNEAGGVLFGFFGSVMLAIVVLYLPFMQTHFAAENRFSAMFDWWGVRMHFRRAPLAFLTALFITLLFALPLYLLKIEATPAEVTWLPALVFVVFIFPARLIAGWAMGRARRREKPRFFLLRWLARFGAVGVVMTYVFFVYLSQYLSWYGTFSFLDQHAFLVPVPFLGV